MCNKTINYLDNEIEEKYNVFYNKYVPISDKADTVGGEILRAANNLVYRYYNDGDTFWSDYGAESCGSSALYLKNVKTGSKVSLSGIIKALEYSTGKDYEMYLAELITAIVVILSDGKLFEEKNDVDSDDAYYNDAVKLWGEVEE